MKVSDIKPGQRLKVSPKSITAKNESGKTCGVIKARDLYPREECEIWGPIRKKVGTAASACLRSMKWIDGKAVYFSNARKADENADKLEEIGFTVVRYIPA